MDDPGRLHVILGTGPLGRAVARHVATTGARSRVVARRAPSELFANAEFMAADLAEPESTRRACAGAAVIYHCVSPPYHLWPKLHPVMMASIIEGAASAGAVLVFGDNLYAYGAVDGPLREDLPYRARGPNGRTRAEIATMLMSAHGRGRLRAGIGRGSDFFGPYARLSLVGDSIFGRAVAGRPVQLLGDPDAPHSVTYLDDFGRALVDIGAREDALGAVWHVPNAPAVSWRQFSELVCQEAGVPLRVERPPRLALRALALVNPTVRAVAEQLYQSDRPWVVDSSKFETTFGWQATPLTESIGPTVKWFQATTAAAAEG